MNEKTIGNLAVAAAVFIFSINYVSMKLLLEHLPTLTLIFLRFAIASIFLTMLVKIKLKRGKQLQEIRKEDKKLVIITGFLGIAVYYFFQGMALNYISASLASLLAAMIPIFTLLTNMVLYKKRMEPFLLGSILAGIFGVFLVLDIGSTSLNTSDLIGCILMLCSVFSWIAYTIKTYELQKKYDSTYLLSKQCTAGTLLLFIIALIDIPKVLPVFQQVEILPSLLLNLIFVGVVCAALGYLFYIYGMERVGVEVAALYLNLSPAITGITSYFILHEPMTRNKVLGIFIVIGALYAVGLRDWINSKKVKVQYQ
ncbi:transporter EamA family [Clostridium aceticum]|uniref:Transporter EamA family n=1 Tax=Clostridium aceticum TaxID=84022 RepID=A0A0D8IBX3_9CLOT|nr:DMT family transporter [Clostridium aceticum]AKL96851.1 transporter EamA family [Clostridium aceticum]KJF27594.1 hypothetical protein TZ02_07370 [Clostridium aceticum]